MSHPNFKQTILITGASAGIGAALARLYFKQGANLVLFARRKERLLELKKELLERQNANSENSLDPILIVEGDVCKKEDLEKATKLAAETFGNLNVVIANAGFGVSGNLEELSAQDYQRQFDTNIFGVIHTIKATLPLLEQSGGSVAMVGSVAGYISLPGISAYSMSKFAVAALADSIRGELKSKGISVTLIVPGFIETEIRKVDNTGTYHQNAKEPVPSWLMMPADRAAKLIARAIKRRKAELVLTLHGKIGVWLRRFFPGILRFFILNSGTKGRPEPKKNPPEARHSRGRA